MELSRLIDAEALKTESSSSTTTNAPTFDDGEGDEGDYGNAGAHAVGYAVISLGFCGFIVGVVAKVCYCYHYGMES